MASKGSLPEECRLALNHIASFELSLSDAYLSMAFCYIDAKEVPHFVPFFEDQAEVKKEHARKFIKHLRSYDAKVALPVIQRPDRYTWGTGSEAIQTALDLETKLDLLLKDLSEVAKRTGGETAIKNFLGTFLTKQTKNLSYLGYQLSYQKQVENLAQEEASAQQAQQSSPEKPSKAPQKS